MNKQLTFLLALTFLFLFSGSSVVFGDGSDIYKGLGLQHAKDALKRQDYETAYNILLPLGEREQGNPEVQYEFGSLYLNSQGFLQDNKKAAKWFRLAAEQGHDKAQYNLGFMYDKGQGVQQDYKEAVKWWRLSAGQRVEQAQYNLVLMHDDSLDYLNSPN